MVTGETGRSEILVFFFRDNNAQDFLSSELPDFERSLVALLEQRGLSVFYPYLRTVPSLPTGTAVALRNPKLNTHSQLRSLIEEAREDADLRRRLEARSQRRSFLQLILGQQVTSVYEPIVEVTTKTFTGQARTKSYSVRMTNGEVEEVQDADYAKASISRLSEEAQPASAAK